LPGGARVISGTGEEGHIIVIAFLDHGWTRIGETQICMGEFPKEFGIIGVVGVCGGFRYIESEIAG